MLAVSIIPLPGWVLVGAGYAGYCYRGYAARFYETSGCAALSKDRVGGPLKYARLIRYQFSLNTGKERAAGI